MWARFRRRSMAPRRPLLFREQIPLAIVSVVVLVAGVAFFVYLALHL
jgi:hypothetical protein